MGDRRFNACYCQKCTARLRGESRLSIELLEAQAEIDDYRDQESATERGRSNDVVVVHRTPFPVHERRIRGQPGHRASEIHWNEEEVQAYRIDCTRHQYMPAVYTKERRATAVKVAAAASAMSSG